MDVEVAPVERIDIGWDRPVSMQDVADIAGRLLDEQIKVRAVPAGVLRAVGLVAPGFKDMGAMVDWFSTGKYVANTTRQAEVFGPPPTAEDAIARFAQSLGHRIA